MHVVEVVPGPTFATGSQRVLFSTQGYRGAGSRARNHALSTDDQRFLMIRLRGASEEGMGELIVVQNWFEELKAIR